MRELIMKMSMSLDGFVSGENGEIDWIFTTGDDKSRQWSLDTVTNASLHIMGRKTFADMAAWWPASKEAFAAPMNAIPKAVFTRRKDFSPARPGETSQAIKDATTHVGAPAGDAGRESWHNAYVASGDMAEEITRLKSGDGRPILAHGGSGFMRSLLATGLVDELRLPIHPVALGKGLPIFTGRHDFRLVEATAFPSGVVAHVYRRREVV